MGCQKAIVKKIVDKQADYILMVEDNQAELKAQIENIFRKQTSRAKHTKEDLDHGRIEKRTYEVITKLDFLDTRDDWEGLYSIIKIISERTIKKNRGL